jgi:hypothetical protein
MPFIEFSQFSVFPNLGIRSQRYLTVPQMKMPLFSNNAQTYYKPHSLATSGVGTVRNSSRKGFRT